MTRGTVVVAEPVVTGGAAVGRFTVVSGQGRVVAAVSGACSPTELRCCPIVEQRSYLQRLAGLCATWEPAPPLQRGARNWGRAIIAVVIRHFG